MPWDARDTMSLRTEFVLFASQDGANIRPLPSLRHFTCHRLQVASPLGGGRAAGLQDRPRIPHHFPNRSSDDITPCCVWLMTAMNAGAHAR